MADKSYDLLVAAVGRLKNAAPEEYVNLVRALYGVGAELRMSLTTAPPDQVFNIQGRCQQTDRLLAAFDPKQPTAQ